MWRSREALGKLKVFSQVRFVGYPVLEHTHRAKMKTIPLPCSSLVALRECVQWPSKQSPTTKLESLSRVSVPRQMVQSFTLRYSFSLKIKKKRENLTEFVPLKKRRGQRKGWSYEQIVFSTSRFYSKMTRFGWQIRWPKPTGLARGPHFALKESRRRLENILAGMHRPHSAHRLKISLELLWN